jgi:hypothetical protein
MRAVPEGIDLVTVMHLHDLDIELGPERGSGPPGEVLEQVDAKAHVT